ncbi:MAG: MBOAT family protein [Desulfobacteraceae bacterium]|nr:MBOAT family protein [Desulfobacteraceae bacterium]
MLFNSFEFIVFLFLVVLLYYHLELRARQILLLIASYTFYAVWSLPYCSLMLISTIIDYLVSNSIEKTKNSILRKRLLWFSIASNLGILAYFKYTNFAIQSACALLSSIGIQQDPIVLQIILPLGISFYTFQTMGYTIDVYNKKIPACKDFLTLAVYVTFFPQLVAGPIERAAKLIPQLCKKQPFSWGNIQMGCRLIIWGLFKKIVFADNLAPFVDKVFSNPTGFSSFEVLLGVYAFAFQIYLDFSAYSQIARGAAALMGIKLMKNFDIPYLSSSITEFWRRWHISLSSWLRDYLYIPLGGSKNGILKTYRNLWVTMVLCGLWHGANWTFVFWGVYHGLLLSIERFCKEQFKIKLEFVSFSWRSILFVILTFHLACIGWVFFRSPTINDAIGVLERLFNTEFWFSTVEALLPMVIVFILIIGHMLYGIAKKQNYVRTIKNNLVVDIVYFITIISCFIIGAASQGAQFIYFEF